MYPAKDLGADVSASSPRNTYRYPLSNGPHTHNTLDRFMQAMNCGISLQLACIAISHLLKVAS
jgi:hypothetical protein